MATDYGQRTSFLRFDKRWIMLQAPIKQRALEIGFDLVGIAPIAAWEDLKFSHQWVERGYGGEMHFLENPKRDDPRLVLPSAKSVICVGLVYNTPFPYSTEASRQKAEGSRQSAEGEKQNSNIENRNSVNPHSKIQYLEPGHLPLATTHSPSATDNGSRTTGKGQRTKDNGLAGRTKDSSPVSNFQSPVSCEEGSPRAWISRYAWGSDYHKILRSKLEELRAAVEELAPGAETRSYVDTGPIVERAFARLSGIGWMGKNTCLINERKGSWFFLGVILTSLALPADLPAPDRCGSCTRCLEACPTGALPEPYVMDASRCISYFTIELKGSIPSGFRSAIGANIFGCDICQDVCPWNARPLPVVSGPSLKSGQRSAISSQRKAATVDVAEFRPMQVEARKSAAEVPANDPLPATDHGPRTTDRFSLFNPPLEALVSFTEEDFRRIFRDSPIKRVKYRGWLRNLCVAMGNSGDSSLVPHLQRLRAHEDPIVREHAEWAFEQLAQAKRLAREPSSAPARPQDERSIPSAPTPAASNENCR